MTKWVKIIIATLYFLSVIFIVFFEGNRTFHWGGEGIHGINFVPFRDKIHFLLGPDYKVQGNAFFFWKEVIGNTMLLIPTPLSIKLLWPKTRDIYLFYQSVIFSLSIELVQLVTGLGHPDMDDLLLNSLGGFIGYVIIKLLPLNIGEE